MVKKRSIKKKTKDGITQQRISELETNPVFREMPRGQKKVTVDKRFLNMFEDERFAVTSAKVDRRGKQITRSGETELHKLYEMESERGDEECEEKSVGKLDLARGEGRLESSSEDSDSEEEIVDDRDRWGQLDANVREVEWTSARLAVCNLDWDKFKAEDVLMALDSFKPAAGVIKTVGIYLSDFGASKLEEEDKSGPKLNEVDCWEKSDDGTTPEEAIRQYQLDKFKYYYAVAECDSKETAQVIYGACDGMEYESSGIRFDLRYIPDETSFEVCYFSCMNRCQHFRLRESTCSEDVTVKKYKPKYFQSAAVSRSNIKMDWDTNDYHRQKAVQKAFQPDADLDECTGLLASGSDEDDELMARNAATLLNAVGINRKVYGSEQKVEESDNKEVNNVNEDESEDKKVLKSDKTPFQEFLERRKEKRKERKARVREMKSSKREESHVAKVSKKRKSTQNAASHLAIDTEDSRFSALFSNSEFAIDTTHSQFKGGVLSHKQVQMKPKRHQSTRN